MSIGYECKLTPLQILTIYNMIANNGTMVKPRFVKEIRQKGQLVKAYPVEIIADSVCSPATIKKAKQLLEGVVQNGTATNLKHSEYQIAGKTGTARIANNNSGYENGGTFEDVKNVRILVMNLDFAGGRAASGLNLEIIGGQKRHAFSKRCSHFLMVQEKDPCLLG